jgi:TolA-binding protein
LQQNVGINVIPGFQGSRLEMKLPKNFLWVVLILIVAVVAYAVGYQGQTIRRLNVGKQGFEVEFEQLKKLPQEELKQRQDTLEQKFRDLQEDARSTPASSQRQQFQQQVDIQGTWQTPTGVSYYIYQNGNAFTFQVISPTLGVTGVGQGTIARQELNFNYVSALYTTGSGSLRLSKDGNQMQGTLTDFSTNTTVSLYLYR